MLWFVATLFLALKGYQPNLSLPVLGDFAGVHLVDVVDEICNQKFFSTGYLWQIYKRLDDDQA